MILFLLINNIRTVDTLCKEKFVKFTHTGWYLKKRYVFPLLYIPRMFQSFIQILHTLESTHE